MIDLNTLISNALIAAVQQAVAPLNERISALEKNEEYLTNRISALEGVDHERQHAMTARWFGGAREEIDALTTRVVALENNPAQGVDTTLEQRVAALESETQGENRYLNRDDVAALIEEALDSHCNAYDHDDYDNHIGDDDKHFDGDIEDAVRDALSNMTFDVSIR